jgi:hypothetical protein
LDDHSCAGHGDRRALDPCAGLLSCGSPQANIGGAASAPIVASAFHPALAPVGALLAVLGYVLGTYCGLVCMRMLMVVAGVSQV